MRENSCCRFLFLYCNFFQHCLGFCEIGFTVSPKGHFARRFIVLKCKSRQVFSIVPLSTTLQTPQDLPLQVGGIAATWKVL